MADEKCGNPRPLMIGLMLPDTEREMGGGSATGIEEFARVLEYLDRP